MHCMKLQWNALTETHACAMIKASQRSVGYSTFSHFSIIFFYSTNPPMSGTCVTAGAFLILRKIVDASKAQKHSARGLKHWMPLRATRTPHMPLCTLQPQTDTLEGKASLWACESPLRRCWIICDQPYPSESLQNALYALLRSSTANCTPHMARASTSPWEPPTMMRVGSW